MAEPTVNADEAKIRTIHDDWIDANEAFDVERMASFFAEDMRYFDVQGGRYDGIDAIVRFEEGARGLASRHPDAAEGKLARITYREPPLVRVDGNIAWLTYVATLRGVLAGNRLEIPFRGTEIYRRDRGGWRMVHGHFSPAAEGK